MTAQTTVNSSAVGPSTATQGTADRISTQGWLLRVESLTILAAALAVYAAYDFAWWMLPALFLVPDLSALGYLLGARTGAAVYNAAHIYAAPLALGGVAFATGWDLGIQLALIWVVHIAVDRLLGYGLKYADSFKHTHLDEV